MITIYSGDNQVESRRALTVYVSRFVGEVVTLVAKDLELESLIHASQSQSMFESQKLIVVEGLLSLPTSARKKELIKTVQEAGQDQDFVIWEPKELTPAQAKSFSGATHKAFKLPQSLFAFLEGITPRSHGSSLKLLNQCHQQGVATQLILYMLLRQFRMLYIVSSGAELKSPPWLKAKLAKQASNYSPESLEQALLELIELDYQAKTSTSPLALRQQLDKWLLQL